MFWGDFGHLLPAMYVVKKVVRSQPEDKNIQPRHEYVCSLAPDLTVMFAGALVSLKGAVFVQTPIIVLRVAVTGKLVAGKDIVVIGGVPVSERLSVTNAEAGNGEIFTWRTPIVVEAVGSIHLSL